MFLLSEELGELTGYKTNSHRAAALNQMGIEHRLRPDGYPLVMRSHVAKLFGGEPQRVAPEYELPWGNLDAAQTEH